MKAPTSLPARLPHLPIFSLLSPASFPHLPTVSAAATPASADRLDTLRRVELAEGVEIALPVAGPFVRAAAFAVDTLLCGLATLAAVLAIRLAFSLVGLHGLATGLAYIAAFLISFGYFAFFEAGRRGATPGKRMRGLRVVQTSGEPITLSQGLVRSFLLFVDFLICCGLIGLASMVLSRRFQRLGDLAAGTVVVYDEHALQPPRLAARPTSLPAAAPLPLRLTREEEQTLLAFTDRAPGWSPERQAELAGLIPNLSGGADARAAQRLLRYGHWLRTR